MCRMHSYMNVVQDIWYKHQVADKGPLYISISKKWLGGGGAFPPENPLQIEKIPKLK